MIHLTEARKNADVKDWLKSYRTTTRNLENHIRHFERIRGAINRYDSSFGRATKATQTWGGAKTRRTSFTDDRADAILDLIEAEASASKGDYDGNFDWLFDDMAELASSGRAVLAAINSVGNAYHKDCLFRRYVSGDKWEKIAIDMSVSVDTVYKWHGAALEEIKRKGVYKHGE